MSFTLIDVQIMVSSTSHGIASMIFLHCKTTHGVLHLAKWFLPLLSFMYIDFLRYQMLSTSQLVFNILFTFHRYCSMVSMVCYLKCYHVKLSTGYVYTDSGVTICWELLAVNIIFTFHIYCSKVSIVCYLKCYYHLKVSTGYVYRDSGVTICW